MADIRRDLTRTTLAILCLLLMIVGSQFMSRLAFQHRSQRDFHFFGS